MTRKLCVFVVAAAFVASACSAWAGDERQNGGQGAYVIDQELGTVEVKLFDLGELAEISFAPGPRINSVNPEENPAWALNAASILDQIFPEVAFGDSAARALFVSTVEGVRTEDPELADLLVARLTKLEWKFLADINTPSSDVNDYDCERFDLEIWSCNVLLALRVGNSSVYLNPVIKSKYLFIPVMNQTLRVNFPAPDSAGLIIHELIYSLLQDDQNLGYVDDSIMITALIMTGNLEQIRVAAGVFRANSSERPNY